MFGSRCLLTVGCVLLLAVLTVAQSPAPFFAFNVLGAKQVSTSNELSSLVNDITRTQRPEVILAFLLPQMSAAEFGESSGAYTGRNVMPNLQNYLTSTPSLSSPHINLNNQRVSQLLANTVSAVNTQANIVPLSIGAQSTCDDIVNGLSAHANLFSNGHTDLMLLSFTDQLDLAAKDACMHKIVESVSAASKGQFSALLTSDLAKPIQLNYAPAQPSPMFLQVADSNTPTGVKFMTPVILFGLMFGLLFLLALYCGMSCLFSIQTPLKFPTRRLAVNKEY